MDKSQLIAALEKEREELVKRLSSLDVTILTMKQSMSFQSSSNGRTLFNGQKNGEQQTAKVGSNDKEKPFKQRVLEVFKAEKRFLHVREISAMLRPEYDLSDEDLTRKVSQALYNLKGTKNSPITRKQIGAQNVNNFWGSKNWLDEKGNVKKEHMYKEDQVTEEQSSLLEI